MKARVTKLIGYTIIALCILTSCDNGEGLTPEPYIRGQDWSWGYMHGTVERPLTGEKISVNHVQHPNLKSRQNSTCFLSPRPDREKPDPDDNVLFYYMTFFFNDKEAYNYLEWQRTKQMLPNISALHLTLFNNFPKGEVIKVADGEKIVRFDDGSIGINFNHSVSIETHDNVFTLDGWIPRPLDHSAWRPQSLVKYVPIESEALLVHLDFVESKTKDGFPMIVLEGHLKGTLYREDNPKDYMVVDISFGM
jgi:hypothetical protein